MHCKSIGRFQILAELGRGGFGYVYLAFDPLLARDVALKMPRPEALRDASLRRRCLTEVRAAGKLDHPNIVRVLEAGEVGAIFYAAMQYVQGPTLAHWMRTRAANTPPRVAARWVEQLASAVADAHEGNIVHRDIKPSNILLQTASARRDRDAASAEAAFVPMLADFGLAKFTTGPHDDTRSGTVLGTPQYMSPEQAEGKTHVQGPATRRRSRRV